MADIENAGSCWPKIWLTTPYIEAEPTDRRLREEQQHVAPLEEECRQSWEKMFDLTLVRRPGLPMDADIHSSDGAGHLPLRRTGTAGYRGETKSPSYGAAL